ncbi:unnamed protein product [Fraxinus pennsylvanica]|uniref:Aspergillus nuclease S1 n=1 Tax=Fraxinus pennsylvanica TaxID=56036 RepID=A0AAD2DXT4_9LAMI|nr:unnamed protein product [Fraxinus pennsylvanica]
MMTQFLNPNSLLSCSPQEKTLLLFATGQMRLSTITTIAEIVLYSMLIHLTSGDCHDASGHKDRCVTGAIYNYTKQLESASHDSDSLGLKCQLIFHRPKYYLKPLHVGFIGDEGGNTIKVRWYTRKTNLHHVWDTMIIESAMKTFYNKDLNEMIQSIQSNITEDWLADVPSWENCNATVCPDTLVGTEPDLVLFFDCAEEDMMKQVLNHNQSRKVFTSFNLPVIKYYSEKGKLYKIDATGTEDEIFKRVCHVFAALRYIV